jgi:hypothetical protein
MSQIKKALTVLTAVVAGQGAFGSHLAKTHYICQFGNNLNFDLSDASFTIQQGVDGDYFQSTENNPLEYSEYTQSKTFTITGEGKVLEVGKHAIAKRAEGSVVTGKQAPFPMLCIQPNSGRYVLVRIVTENVPMAYELRNKAFQLCGGYATPAGKISSRYFYGVYRLTQAFQCN